MRDLPLGHVRKLRHALARIRIKASMKIQTVVCRPYHRLCEVHRVRDDYRERQQVSVPQVVFDDDRLAASGDSIDAKVTLSQVSRGDLQAIVIPFPGREALKRMGRVRRRMRRPSM